MNPPSNRPRHHTLVVLVENKAGVLTRVAGLFARRGFNIYSLAVAPTDDDERFSRITIVVDVESSPLEQITKQLFKLINVVKISELDPADSVERELMIATVKADPTVRSQVLELVDYDGTTPPDRGNLFARTPVIDALAATGRVERSSTTVRLAGHRRSSIQREHLLGIVGADPRPQPARVEPKAAPLLRPLTEYEAVAGGRW